MNRRDWMIRTASGLLATHAYASCPAAALRSGTAPAAQRISMPAQEPARAATGPGDPFTVFDDGRMGATWTHFNRVGGLQWKNPGGDWLDAQGKPQGAVPISTGRVVKSNEWVDVDVLAFMAGWLQHNLGLFVRGTTTATYATREHEDAALRPHLKVTTESGEFHCPCVSDVHFHRSSNLGLGERTTMSLGQGMLRFDVSGVRGTPRTAIMRVYALRSTGTGELRCFHIDPVRTFDVGTTRMRGLSAEAADLSRHPDVLVLHDWKENWRSRFPRVREDSPCVAERRDGEWWLRVQMPVDPSCTRKGEGTGLAVSFELAEIPDSIDQIPRTPMGPTHAFARYSIRLGEDWTSVDDPQLTGGKLPGFAGRYGYPSSYGGRNYWQSTMEGGRRSKGRYIPAGGRSRRGHFSGWAARINWEARALGQHDNPMRNATPIGSYLYHPGWTREGSGEPRPWPNVQLVAGREYDIEQEVRINSVSGPFDEYGNGVGQPDGILRAWVDGVLVYEDTAMVWTHHPAIAIQQFWMTFKNGGTLSPCKPHHLHVGRVIVARRYIGPRR